MRIRTATRHRDRHTVTRGLAETSVAIGFGMASSKELQAAGRTEKGNRRRTYWRHLHGRIAEAGWHALRTQLKAKAVEHGGLFVEGN